MMMTLVSKLAVRLMKMSILMLINDENADEMLMMMMFPAAACIAVMRRARRAIVGKTQFATRR